MIKRFLKFLIIILLSFNYIIAKAQIKQKRITLPQDISIEDEIAYQISMGRGPIFTLKYILSLENNTLSPEQILKQYEQFSLPPQFPQPEIDFKILILIGDYYHHPSYIKQGLEKLLQTLSFLYPTHYSIIYNHKLLSKEILSHYNILIVLKDGMLRPNPQEDNSDPGKPEWWLSDEQEEDLINFVKNGGGYLALHNATALKTTKPSDNAPYNLMLGSCYNGHGPADEIFDVVVVNKEHPITKDVLDYQAQDELHTPYIYSFDDIIILTKAKNAKKEAINGYAKLYGNGKIVYLANGHNLKMLTQPSMQKLMLNALLWLNNKTNYQ